MNHYLVTGATSGIGRATALALAKRKLPLILVGRDKERLIRSTAQMRAAGAPEVESLQADLSSLRSTQQVAAQLQSFTLGGALLAAGILEPNKRSTIDGLEMNYMVNHLSKFMLLAQLGDKWAKSKTRLVLGAPVGAVTGSLDDLRADKKWRMMRGVETSQYANDLMALGLPLRFPGLLSTAWNPGPTKGTQVARHMPLWAKALFGAVQAVGRGLEGVGEQGAALLTTPSASALTWVLKRDSVDAPLREDETHRPAHLWEYDLSLTVRHAEAPTRVVPPLDEDD